MKKYYFTYGTDGHPFVGGWTEVVAPDMDVACQLFRKVHHDRTFGLLNCAFVYTEVEFEAAGFTEKGNLGAKCHERILVDGCGHLIVGVPDSKFKVLEERVDETG